jgi:hypothetical protein
MPSEFCPLCRTITNMIVTVTPRGMSGQQIAEQVPGPFKAAAAIVRNVCILPQSQHHTPLGRYHTDRINKGAVW